MLKYPKIILIYDKYLFFSMSNREKVQKLQMSETFRVGALLAIAGGFLDAYTYLYRDGVFANAQTGNIVLFSIHLSQGAWFKAFAAAMPILAFFLGIIITEVVKTRHKYEISKFLHWRHETLLLEIIVLTVALFIPKGSLNFVVNIMISFVCSLQVQSFRSIHGHGVASTMCTGNLRSGTEALCQFISTKNHASRHKFLCYYGMILSFIFGGVLGAVVTLNSPKFALLLPIVAHICVFLLMMKEDATSSN